MNHTVLFVDDEENILNSIRRLFADSAINVLCAHNANHAIDIMSRDSISVIVTDNQMPGMSGIELLGKIKDVSPDTLKILMTAYADLTVAVDAINKGEVFRFITKPWDDDALLQTVQEAVRRYDMIQTLKSGDEALLRSLSQTIELKDPYTRGHSDRVADYSTGLAHALHLPEAMIKAIRTGSILHDCGKIGVPEHILKKKSGLNEAEYEVIKYHPRWGADVALQANLSSHIVNIILHHHERYDGSGYPSGLQGTNIPLEARIVTLADVYDALSSERCYRHSYNRAKAIQIMLVMKGIVFDPEIFDMFLHTCLRVTDDQISSLLKQSCV